MAYRILVGGYSALLATLVFQPLVYPPALTLLTQSPSGLNASWLALHPTNSSVVFGTQELSPLGAVASFIIGSDGSARAVSNVTTYGDAPAYVGVSSNLLELLAMNYNSGNGVVIPLARDGVTLSTPPPQGMLTFNGSGPNLARQLSAHPHMEFQNGYEVLVPDLGSDKVWRLARTAPFTYNITGYIQQPLGSGPRHGVIYTETEDTESGSVSTTYLYMIHELANTVTQQTLPAVDSGVQPELLAMLPTIPPGADNSSITAAELLLNPVTATYSEQYLYASNRGDTSPLGDSIAIFSPNPLTLVAQVRTGLQGIRGMMLGGDQSQYLIAGGQEGGGIAIFERTAGGANLTLLARLNTTEIVAPTTFVWLN